MDLSRGAFAPNLIQTLTPRAQELYRLARWFWNRGKIFKAGREWIAARLKCSVRSISRAIAELAAAGIWEPQRRYRRTNIYEPAQVAQMTLDFAPSEPSKEPLQAAQKKDVGTILGTTVVKPESRKLWRRVVSVPLVLFRVPEHWRKRREAKNAGRTRKPTEAEIAEYGETLAQFCISRGTL